MKYAVLATGVVATGWFIYSFFVLFGNPAQFKIIAFGFLVLAIVFFILVLIRKIRERKGWHD
jgi:succinate-acetate transporter protein